MADIIKIKLGANVYNVKDASAARKNVYYGTCTTAANTYKKVATVETFPLDGNGLPLIGTLVAIKYSNTNTYKTEGQTYQLNVNNTGDFPMYYNNAALATSTPANTLVAGYKNRHIYYMFNGSQWVWVTSSYDANTTYSGMTQAEVDAGTGTTNRLISPKMLRDNFYKEDECDAKFVTSVSYDSTSKKIQYTKNSIATDVVTISDVATSGSYNDLSNKPTIPTAATSAPLMDGTADVGSSSKYAKEDHVHPNDTSRVPTSRKINNKPLSTDITLTASDVGALPNTTTIPTVPTNVSSFTNDAGYLTSHLDISGKADKSEMSVSTSSDTTTITLKSGTSATVINQHNIVVGKLQNGNFYKGTYLAQVVPDTWAFSSTAEVGNFNKIYVDVLTNSIYKYEGSYVSVTGDFVTYDQYNIDILDLWENKADVIQVVTVSTTGAVTLALEPNTFYLFTGNPTSLTLTLTSGTGLCVYAGKFTAGTGFSNLSLPASVKEADGIPSIEAGNTYEFSIMDNLLLLVKEGS